MDLFAPQTSVKISTELLRIHKLPRRQWSSEEAEQLAVDMTDALKTPGGTMKLRPLQAVALYEIGTEGGLLGPLTVGCGKTLISLLAPTVLFAKRPLLLVPAKLVEKTERDKRLLSLHWDIPEFIRIMSYEWLGLAQAAEALEQFEPDVVVSDEAHKIKNIRAARTRRCRRFFVAHPEVKCIAMSGTFTKRSLHDYAHTAYWSLKRDKFPLPKSYHDLATWADALDERKGQSHADPGALKIFCNEEELKLWDKGDFERRRAARSGFRRRLIETAGVVASFEAAVDATITIQSVEPPASEAIDKAFAILRQFETPDGWPIGDGLTMFRHARELALGFYYVWDPRPPPEWLEPRRVWCKFVRSILKHSRKLDSELQVAREYPEAKELLEWRAVKKTFEPNTVPVWLDTSVLEYAAAWAERESGIVWVEHTCFGERLEKDFGITYYGAQGLNKSGGIIEDHPAGSPLAASRPSNGEGWNLQKWSTNLITAFPANGQQNEQMIGRTHREGQMADEVTFDVLVSCHEHVTAFWQAMSDSEYVRASTGAPQKILLAGVNMPTLTDLMTLSGDRWEK